MNANATFERDLARWLEAEAPTSGPAGLNEFTIARAATMRQRPRWVAILRDGTFPSPAGVVRRPAGRMTYAFIVLGLILALIVAVLVAGAFRSQPYRAPSWTATGSMVTPRGYHTATLLPDGRVLVAGGSLGSPASGWASLSSAELYDPASWTWAATERMSTRRSRHTATLLRDGRVLVAGDGTAELYDPVAGTWTATGALVTACDGQTATLLRDGKVLVAGGSATSGASTCTELYDPASGTWTATGNMITAHGSGVPATLLPDGRVLVAGGYATSGASTSAELYDPASGTWTATGDMLTLRGEPPTATLLPDGTVLVAGGFEARWYKLPPGPSAELYDPSTGAWTATGEMKTVRSYHTATLLPNGKVFVTGDGGAVSAELYDPITRSWTTTSNSIDHFNAETATLLPDGNVLLVGGYNGIQGTSGDVGIAGAELYDPGVGVAPSASASATPPVTRPPVVAPPVATPSPSPSVIQPGAPRWTAIGSKLTLRQGPTVRLLRDGRVLVFGGLELLASAELYDPATGTSAATGSMVTHAGPRSWLTSDSFTATLLRDGKVLVAGGSGDSITESLASAELYDPASGTWTATGNMVTAHGRGSTATLLPDGKVLVAGGDGGSGATATAELYDPANGTWTTTGSMVTPRFGHTATLLADGNVLVAGGVGYPVLASAELYHPDSGTWTATGSMARPRVGHTTAPGHTATLLSDGRVLVVGGNGGSAAAVPRIDAELYDPATGTWTATRSMVTPRFEGQTATLLLDGRVLVAGGSDFQVMPGGELGRITALASAELFEPATGSWTATASMGKPREGQTAMLLPDGTVLVVGGSNYNPAGYLTVELYDSGTGN